MVRVKICGITSPGDARHAADCGADAVGLVFFAGSPRCVTPERAREIIGSLPPFVTPVGLFVNEKPETIRQIIDFSGIDMVQLHGDEPPAACHYPPHRVIKALRVKDPTSLEGVGIYPVSALLLDAWVPDAFGGTGRTFNWVLAAEVAREHRVVLAGGLTPENVAAAVASVRPFAVDVSSGVESTPGCKDPLKVAAFIRNAKRELE